MIKRLLIIPARSGSKRIKNKNIVTYGENSKANYRVSKIKYYFESTKFDLSFKDKSKSLKTIKNINVKLLGKHNVLNAAAALIVCLNLGVNQNVIKKSLKNFSGVQRRMTKVFSKNKNDFYDDYAHHPTEISSILDGVRNVNKKRKIMKAIIANAVLMFFFLVFLSGIIIKSYLSEKAQKLKINIK